MPEFTTDHSLIASHRDDVTETLEGKTPLIPKYRAYARGEQASTLTEKQKAMLEGVNTYTRADNICHTIIAEAASRIELQREEERAAPWCDDKQVQAFIDELSVKNALEDLEGEVTYNAFRDGNASIRVYWNPLSGRIELIQEPWWDGEEGMFCFAGDDLFPPYAVKEWNAVLERKDKQNVTGKRRYVWYEDRIESWVLRSSGGEWEPYPIRIPGTEQVIEDGVVPWLKGDNKPLHIPVVHFANAGRMTGKQGNYGLSELSGGILNKQDEINEADAALTSATRFSGFPIVVIKAFTPDPASTTDPFEDTQIVAGTIFADMGEHFDVKRLEPGEVQPIIDAKIEKLRAASRASRTPLHNITGGDWPSGAALDKAETPAVNKAKRQAAKFAPAWATVFHRASEIGNVFGKLGLNEKPLIRVTFNSFERRDPMYVLSLKRAEWALEQDMKNGLSSIENRLNAAANGG